MACVAMACADPGSRLVRDDALGFFAPEQAERGARVFDKACSRCHSVDSGSPHPQGLSGPEFIARWQSVAGLYNKSRWTMPADAVMSLGEDETLDVTAFLLQANGFGAGRPLVADEREMKMRVLTPTGTRLSSDVQELGVRGGFYTEAQARRGRAFFEGSCRSCHDAEIHTLVGVEKAAHGETDAEGRLQRPGINMGRQNIVMPLSGVPELHPRSNVAELYLEAKTTMPIEYPDGLSEQAYLDIVAYLLQVRGLPAGSSELEADLEVLGAMTLLEPGYRKLFDGEAFGKLGVLLGNGCDPPPEGCGSIDPGETFRLDGGLLRVSGRPSGYIYTLERFREFSLRLELRYQPYPGMRDDTDYYANTGLLLFVEEHRVWPRSLEVQGYYPDVFGILPIDTTAEFTVDQQVRKSFLRPIGEWNALEIVSKDASVRVFLNGALVTTVHDHEFEGPGSIGIQSEGAVVDFRNIRIREF
jgi:cytochrome c2